MKFLNDSAESRIPSLMGETEGQRSLSKTRVSGYLFNGRPSVVSETADKNLDEYSAVQDNATQKIETLKASGF